MPLSVGQVLENRYRIVKLLGQGGFGASVAPSRQPAQSAVNGSNLIFGLRRVSA
jgi:hypothetical protein